ncbi:hypothetical protein [Chryseobacterium balustinum]|uniref:hypothetical protein n=1 Tax=Chryseobacterium balustinum TaxID=246 RepID=UPI003CF82D87
MCFCYSQKFDNSKIHGFPIQPEKEGKYPVIIFNRSGNREFGAVGIDMMAQFLSKIFIR